MHLQWFHIGWPCGSLRRIWHYPLSNAKDSTSSVPIHCLKCASILDRNSPFCRRSEGFARLFLGLIVCVKSCSFWTICTFFIFDAVTKEVTGFKDGWSLPVSQQLLFLGRTSFHLKTRKKKLLSPLIYYLENCKSLAKVLFGAPLTNK